MSCFTMRRLLVCLALPPLVGCLPTVDKGPIPSGSADPIATFRVDATDECAPNTVTPYPSDLAFKNFVVQDGVIVVPYCPSDLSALIPLTPLKEGLNASQFDGFAIGTVAYAPLTVVPDPATVAAGVVFVQTSLTRPNQNPVPVAYKAKWSDTDGRLYLTPNAPLAPGQEYVLAITSALKDMNGKSFINDATFTYLKEPTPLFDLAGHSRFAPGLSDEHANDLEPTRVALARLFDVLGAAPLNVGRQDVAVAWSFKTTSKTFNDIFQLQYVEQTDLPPIVGPQVVVDDAGPADANLLLAGARISTTNICSIYTGRVTLRNLLTATGTFGVENDTPVPFILTTPDEAATDSPPSKTTACAKGTWDPALDPWKSTTTGYAKLAVFAHALGRCKNDALVLANTLGSQGWAVLALDAPASGSRELTDQGIGADICPIQNTIPDFIALPGQEPNPFAMRDEMREWGLELSQVLTLAKTKPWMFSHITGTAEPPGPFNPRVGLVGHSWGGMAAAIAGALNPLSVDAIVINAASGNYHDMFEPLLVAGGVPANLLADSLGVYVWVMEVADPIYAPPTYPATFPPVFAQVVDGGDLQAPLHYTTTQQDLAAAFVAKGRATRTFTLAACPTANALVGSLLQPCSTTDAATTADMQTRMEHFLSTGTDTP